MDFEQQRKNMINGQLRPNIVMNEKMLQAYELVPRECLIGDADPSLAYADTSLKVFSDNVAGKSPSDIWISEPTLTGQLLAAANIKTSDNVLIPYATSGYCAALAGVLGGYVFGVMQSETLMKKALDVLTDVGIDNVFFRLDKAINGWVKEGPYDVILMEGGLEQVPPLTIFEQLSNEGGRLVGVEMQHGEPVGQAVCWHKHQDGSLTRHELFDASITVIQNLDRVYAA